MKSLSGRLAVIVATLIIFSAPLPAASTEHTNDAGAAEQEPPPSTMKTVIVGVLVAASLISIFLIV